MTGRARARLRRAAGWLPALILVPATITAGVVLSQPEDDLAAMREEHPLDLGTTWVYDVFDHGEPSGTRTSQVVGPADMVTSSREGLTPALKLTRDYTGYPGLGRRRIISYLGLDGATMYQYGQVEAGSYSSIEPPAVAYLLPVEEGARWSYEGLVGTNEHRFEVELTEITDVEVGGHTFEGCAHFVNTVPIEREGEPMIEEVIEEWTCPGYGPVRSVDRVEALDIEITEELAEFHGVEANWYAEGRNPGDPHPADDLPGTTVGFASSRSFAVEDGQLGREPAWTDFRGQSSLHPPISDGEITVTAEPNGLVSLRTNDIGEMRWRVQLAEPVLAAPLLSDDRVIVADAEKRVWALSVDDGRALWVRTLGDVVSSSPTRTPAGIAVPTDDGVVTMLDPADGDDLWQVELDGAPRTHPAFDGDRLLVGDQSGRVSSIDPDDGELQWSRTLDDGLAQGPISAGGLVLALDRRGVVHAWTGDGDVEWQTRSTGLGSAPMAAGSGVALTSVNDEQVTAFDLGDGSRKWTRRFSDLGANPVIVGDEVLVPTDEGRVLVLALDDGSTVDQWRLPPPADGTKLSNTTATALLGGTVVISADVEGDPDGAILFAYPLRHDVPSGPEMSFRIRPVPGLPNEPLLEVGDDLVGGFGQELLRVAPDGSTTRLLRSEGVQTGAAVQDGTVVARKDDSVVGLRIEDGAQLWWVPGGATARGAVPALANGTAYFGVADDGLAAVDLRTGEERWRTPLPAAVTVTTPLTLPNGDVVYGGGGLARYDGRTGEPLWQDPEAHTFAPVARSGDVLFAVSVSHTGLAGIGAWDATTGRRLWFQEMASVSIFLGPVVSDGVVVASDEAGLVTAYDAHTGERLWQLAARQPLAGQPVVRDGHVVLVEKVIAYDVNEADVRASVHDLHTGRFLSAWEPNNSPTTTGQPIAGGTPDGRLLYPTSFGLIEVTVQ